MEAVRVFNSESKHTRLSWLGEHSKVLYYGFEVILMAG